MSGFLPSSEPAIGRSQELATVGWCRRTAELPLLVELERAACPQKSRKDPTTRRAFSTHCQTFTSPERIRFRITSKRRQVLLPPTASWPTDKQDSWTVSPMSAVPTWNRGLCRSRTNWWPTPLRWLRGVLRLDKMSNCWLISRGWISILMCTERVWMTCR